MRLCSVPFRRLGWLPARAAVLLLVSAAGFAADAAAPLTLAEAQRLAQERNADLRSASAAAQVAAAQVRIAREFPNPTLGLSVAGIATDGTGNATRAGNRFLDRSYDSIVALSQLFELGGKRGLRHDAARAGQRAAEAQRDDARRLLLQAVTQAYIAALEAREEGRVLAASAATLQREAELAATRHRAGDLSAADQAQIEIAATRFSLEAAAARHTATAAAITLETLLGEPAPAGRVELTDTLDTLVPPPAAIAPDQPAAGLRPDIAAAEANLAKAELDFKSQRRAVVPDVTVSAQFERNPPDRPDLAGVGLSLPLPLWNRNAGGIHAARAARDQAQAQLDKVHTQAAAEIATARSALREAQARAQAYAMQLRPKSAGVASTVAYAYEKGGASLVELLSAQRNDNDIRLATARAQAESAAAAAILTSALNRFPAAAGPSPLPP